MARTEMMLMMTILMTVLRLLVIMLMEVVLLTAFSLSRAMAVQLRVETYIETPWEMYILLTNLMNLM